MHIQQTLSIHAHAKGPIMHIQQVRLHAHTLSCSVYTHCRTGSTHVHYSGFPFCIYTQCRSRLALTRARRRFCLHRYRRFSFSRPRSHLQQGPVYTCTCSSAPFTHVHITESVLHIYTLQILFTRTHAEGLFYTVLE